MINLKIFFVLEKLNTRLNDRACKSININQIYEKQAKQIRHDDMISSLIYVLAGMLVYIIYYFIEKSSSLKNSKEYGVFRAIGINKSNLLYKETILAIKNSLITYLVSYLVVTTLISIRYYMMNVSVMMFVGISAIVLLISSLIIVGISLIPYLFVLHKTPSEIISRYDI